MFWVFASFLIYLPLITIGDSRIHTGVEKFDQLVTKYGYPLEKHIVETKDGYILMTQRIPHGKGSNKPNDKVIILVHGLAASAEHFLLLGPNNSLALLLADRGFDVWLFNARGTAHSRKHKFLSPDLLPAQFWNFSWHEIGIYDLPANIDYILEKTKKSKLFYVGHSQGATSYFVLTSERPEYNSKIEFGVMLAPPILMNHTENIVKRFSKLHPQIEWLLNEINYHEFPSPVSPLFNPIFKTACMISEDYADICIGLIYLTAGLESGLLNRSLIPLILTYTPAGFSARQSLHFMQIIRSGKFRKYDYGVNGNLLRYNQKDPPTYRLNNSNAPVALFFTDGDYLASISQKEQLQKMIPNIHTIYEVSFKKFNHIDFIFAHNAKELVYDPLYEIIMNFEQTKLNN